MGWNDMKRRINNKAHGLDMLWLVNASSNQAQSDHWLTGGVNVGEAWVVQTQNNEKTS